MNSKGRKRKLRNLSLDSNCNKQFKPCNEGVDDQNVERPQFDNPSIQSISKLSEVRGQVEEDGLSSYTCAGEWIQSQARRHDAPGGMVALRSQEDVVLRSTRNGRIRAVTLLAKADASVTIGHVRVISKEGESTKLVRGVHKCFGDQDHGIGPNNVFVTVLIEDKHSTRIVEVGEILGYAKLIDKRRSSIFNTFFTVSFKSGTTRLKFWGNYSRQLQRDETTLVNVSVESLPKRNQRNYLIRFESTNSYLRVIGDRHTIQKGNSARIRIRNVSGKQIVLRNGDILGVAKALNTEEFIENIQGLNKDALKSLNAEEFIEEIQNINKDAPKSLNTEKFIEKIQDLNKDALTSINTEELIEEIQQVNDTLKSLSTEEFIDEIQHVNSDASYSTGTTRLTTTLSPDFTYSIVFLEIETLRPSNSSTKQITQIGCCSSLSKERNFFQVIEPTDLNHYLSNFQIGGDLLQFLHLQKNNSGQFEFRKQFEIVEDGVEVPQCSTEGEALRELALFLASFSSDCVLVSIRKETVQLVVERLKHHGIDYGFLKGFCTWESYLENTISSVGSSVEFDDWYSANVNDDAPSSGLHSEAVAGLHKEAINRISETYFSRSSHDCPSNMATAIIQQSSSPIECLFTSQSETNENMRDSESLPTNNSVMESESPPCSLELNNSFRPNFPATITITRLETLEISSDEDEGMPEGIPVQKTVSSDKDEGMPEGILVQNIVPATVEATPAMTNDEEIFVSDTEPDEVIFLPLPDSRDHPATSKIYCEVCKRRFKFLNGLQYHLRDNKEHSKRLNKLLDESRGQDIQAATPSDSCGNWNLYETILWAEFKSRLSSLRCTINKKSERFDDIIKTKLECLAIFALNLQNRAELLANHVEKQLPEKTIETVIKKVVPIRLVFFIGSLSQKSNIFREAFENRLVGNFIRAQQVSTIRDLKLFVDLRMEWEDLAIFKTETLEELDYEMSKDYSKWKSSLQEIRQSAKSKD